MEKISRRKFVGNASALAAGAVAMGAGISVGKRALKGYRQHGVVDFKMFVFSPDPYVMKGWLFSDDTRNVFGFIIDHGGWGTITVRTPLSPIERTVLHGDPTKVKLEIYRNQKLDEEKPVSVSIVDDKFMLHDNDHPDAPLWISLRDIQKVIA